MNYMAMVRQDLENKAKNGYVELQPIPIKSTYVQPIQQPMKVNNTMETQQKNQILNYVGYYMGSQPKHNGVRKDGTAWESHDILFHHGDMTKPIRFTWFGQPPTELPNTVMCVAYVMEEFTTKAGQQAKSKKAIKLHPHTGQPLGYQQTTAPPEPSRQAPVQPKIEVDLVALGQAYKADTSKAQDRKTVEDFIGVFIKNSDPALYTKLQEFHTALFQG